MSRDVNALPWTEVRRRLRGRPERELLRLIGECYRASAEVRERLSIELMEGRQEREEAIRRCRGRIEGAFWAEDRRGGPVAPDLRAARACVSRVAALTDDPGTRLDAMLDFVEHGVGFANMYGDLWQGYYDSVEGMFLRAREALLANRDGPDAARVMARVEAIVGKCRYEGYGFRDNLEGWTEELREELLRSRDDGPAGREGSGPR
jgi:hypothetical protein